LRRRRADWSDPALTGPDAGGDLGKAHDDADHHHRGSGNTDLLRYLSPKYLF
jgi:hypothetical protein